MIFFVELCLLYVFMCCDVEQLGYWISLRRETLSLGYYTCVCIKVLSCVCVNKAKVDVGIKSYILFLFLILAPDCIYLSLLFVVGEKY